MTAGRLDQHLDNVLSLWHSHRVLVIFGTGILYTFWRFLTYRTQQHEPPQYVEIKGQSLQEQRIPRQVAQDILVPATVTSANSKVKAKVKSEPKRVSGARTSRLVTSHAPDHINRIQPLIFYYSLGGSSKAYAEAFVHDLSRDGEKVLPPIAHDLTEIDYDDYFISPPKTPNTSYLYLLLIPSYDIDTELSNFLSHLEETHHDFRIDTAPLRDLAGYSVFGFGDRSEWPSEREGFCVQAIEVDKWMARLTDRRRAYPIGLGDTKMDVQERLNEWRTGVEAIVHDIAGGKGLGEGTVGSGDAVESGDEEEEEDGGGEVVEQGKGDATRIALPRKRERLRSTTTDLEDIKVPIPVDFTSTSISSNQSSAPKAMVPKTSPTYASLTKQGYTIVGSHSGVKICRWTKSALRGRGSCYKYSFYGIASHLCMEATPSLSCSNKCVFCWRHGTNPVGTTWRWQVDPPEEIFAGIKEGHYKKIKMLRGVPGVRADRFSEAMRIRHCALSLVGEPIFYPHINRLLSLLHAEHISSFLVCNAQHPDQLASLGPVTQLYVSIDASNKESLKRIDRPLHRDFWERFTRCMDILREKRFTHRTVFRLTLVKGFNLDDEVEGYADLVARALPGFVEVKGVTYCGTSTAAGAGLSMQNVPFYEEVCAFVLALEAALERRGLSYGIGAEHAHSCCILLADRRRFYRPSRSDGVERWHTLIDYPAFFRCVESGKSFAPEDYIGEPTAEWALWGNGGFDPRDQRVDRKGRPKEL